MLNRISDEIIINRVNPAKEIMHTFVFRAPYFHRDREATVNTMFRIIQNIGINCSDATMLNSNKNGYSIWSMDVWGDAKKVEKFLIEAKRVEEMI
jgi:hypothetical protein